MLLASITSPCYPRTNYIHTYLRFLRTIVLGWSATLAIHSAKRKWRKVRPKIRKGHAEIPSWFARWRTESVESVMTVLLAPVGIHHGIDINLYYTQGSQREWHNVRQRLINQIHVGSCSHRQLRSFVFGTEALYQHEAFVHLLELEQAEGMENPLEGITFVILYNRDHQRLYLIQHMSDYSVICPYSRSGINSILGLDPDQNEP